MSAIPPATQESVPDTIEEPFKLEVPPDIRQVHAQLLQDAQRNFSGEEYSEAIKGLKRLLALKPEEKVEEEGLWLLAQAYGHAGEWEAARDQYRLLAGTGKGHRYQSDAERRLHELQRLLEEFEAPPLNTQAIRLTLEQLPTSTGFDQGIKKMKEDGITTLLIDLGCQNGQFPTETIDSSRRSQPLLGLKSRLRSYVERSHRMELLVYVGVNLRCIGHWHESPSPDWRDRSYNMAKRTLHENRFFDIFHPEYRQFLNRFFAHLSEDRVDGLVFLDDYPLGVFDGMSVAGLSGFQRAFGMDFDPGLVFQPGFDPVHDSEYSEDSLFWRWVGWKARERLNVLEDVIGHLRKRHFTVQCGLELHPHGLTDPVRALVKYAQDAMEATRRPFSFFFVRPEIDRQSTFDQRAVVEKLRRISTKAVLTRLLPVLDDPRRVWLSMPAESGKRLMPGTAADAQPLLHDFPSGIGVVHDLRAFS